ncbi:MAG: mechanosensitive ion channel family protein [Victivallaceae bacterium]
MNSNSGESFRELAAITDIGPLRQIFENIIAFFVDQQVAFVVFGLGMLCTVAAVFLISFLTTRVVLMLTARTKTDLDDRIVRQLHTPLRLLVLATGVVLSLRVIKLPLAVADFLPRLYYATATLILVWGMLRVIGVLDVYFKALAAKTGSSLDDLLIDLLRRVSKAAIWVIAVIFIAQNIFKLNVSALLAGAGVLGLAIAFAAQNTIANIFGAITLILDKPFKIGDRVEVGGSSGMVEAIGLRSTRLRTLDGTLWYVPNREMADSKLLNYAKRPNIKYGFDLGLTYDTTPEQMTRAMAILHEILDGHALFDMENLPPRIFFTDFKEYSLNISVIVWFQTVDFFEMQDARNAINLAILERFNAEGLSFAFPSRTNYLVNTNHGESKS